jgi:chorismate mutase / prephenate dehydratase
MKPFRDRIDAIDRTILELLNERADCANQIGHIKKQLGLPDLHARARRRGSCQRLHI